VIISYLVLRFKPEFMGDFRMAFILGIAPALILAVLFIPWLGAVLGIRPLTYLGSLSIVIYLVHFPVQCAIRTIDEYAGLGLDYSTKAVWLSYAAAVLISSVVYRLVIAKAAEKAVFGFFSKKETSPQKKTA
jgi:peptidoglycan/LPS O-acetylase OafA/YrhL